MQDAVANVLIRVGLIVFLKEFIKICRLPLFRDLHPQKCILHCRKGTQEFSFPLSR